MPKRNQFGKRLRGKMLYAIPSRGFPQGINGKTGIYEPPSPSEEKRRKKLEERFI
jgi:hypothetical protein